MSELEVMIDEATQQVQQHEEGLLRQRVATLLTPEAQRVLELSYAPDNSVLLIGCLGMPCWLRFVADRGVWQFGCPWWQSMVPEDKLFEARLLTEVGKAKMALDGMGEKIDPKKVN